MKKLYRELFESIDRKSLLKHISELTKIELGQTFRDYHKSVDYVCRLMKKSEIPNIEKLSFPADGKTVYHDKVMPLAWDATVGKLTLLNAKLPASSNPLLGEGKKLDSVVADYKRHPFHLVKGSVATPEGGMETRIITEAQFLAGEDPRGAMVMLEPLTWPRRNVLTPILDQGGIGFISDFLVGRYQTPYDMQWVNACSETSSWHVNNETRPFIGFSVSPETGDSIRKLANADMLKAKIECDGRRYEGTLPAATALIPGRRKEEIWMLAHLFEPLANDDSAGTIFVIEAAKQIMARGTPEFSVRLIFAMEMYGFVAYAASRGTNLRKEVVGGCNFDGALCMKGTSLFHTPGPGTPFYGNAIGEQLIRDLKGVAEAPPIKYVGVGEYFDDILLSDPTVGIPTVWPFMASGSYGLWHNSAQTPDTLDEETSAKGVAFNTTFMISAASPSHDMLKKALKLAVGHLKSCRNDIDEKPFGSDAERFRHCYECELERLADFSRFMPEKEISKTISELKKSYMKLSRGLTDVIPHSKWRDYAENIVATRKETGFPHELAKVPKSNRIALPDHVIYGAFANVLSNMDGKKTLAQIIREAEYERAKKLDEATVKKYADAVCFLGEYGYLKVKNKTTISEDDIVRALEKLGVKNDGLFMVHSSVSACGYIPGGAKTIISSLLKAAGKKGTVLFPTFTYPYLSLDGHVNKSYLYHPFDPNDVNQVWTGTMPRKILSLPEVIRSRHITHSWAGFGPLAKKCLSAHGEYDPPASADSPMEKALELGGKILYFGCGFEPTTFLHFIEDHFDLPGLGQAVCAVKQKDGSVKKVIIEKHLPGDRDFYHNADKCKFFTKAFAARLKVKCVPLGVGELRLIDIKELFTIASKIVKKQPDIML